MTTSDDDAVAHWLAQAGRVPLLTAAEEIHLGGLVRAWQDHPAGPDGAPKAIARRGLKARNRMVAANLRLVVAVARTIPHQGPRADALQDGAIGLQRAAEKFDPGRGYKFSTYAYWWIRQALTRLQDGTIHMPIQLAQRLQSLNSRRAALELRLGRSATMAELAEDLRLPVSELEAYLQRGASCVSLDVRVGQGESTMIELISTPEADEPDDDRQELLRRLEAWEARGEDGRLEHPTAYQLAQLIRAAWGVDRPHESAREIGARTGLSRYQVGGRLRKALYALRMGRIPPDDGKQLELTPPGPPARAAAPTPSVDGAPADRSRPCGPLVP